MYLGFLPFELDVIQAGPFLLATAPRSWLSTMLAQWLQWAPGDSRGSTNFATLENLKHALYQAGLGVTADNLGNDINYMGSFPGMPCLLFCKHVHCIGLGLWSTV